MRLLLAGIIIGMGIIIGTMACVQVHTAFDHITKAITLDINHQDKE